MDMQSGYRESNGYSGPLGPFPYPAVVVTVSGGLVGAPNRRSDHTSDFGRCACGARLYRKHRIASSLLNLINQALNTSTLLSERKPAIGGSLRVKCPTCGDSLEAAFAVSRPTTGRQGSMHIVLSMQLKTIASTSSEDGINLEQTLMDLLTDDDDDPILVE